MSSREDRLWSALIKKHRDVVAKVGRAADQEAEALADAYARGADAKTIRAIERSSEAQSRQLRDARVRLEREALTLPCGCVCDRCWTGRGWHCLADHCQWSRLGR